MTYRFLRQDTHPDGCAALYPEGTDISTLNSGMLVPDLSEPVRVYLSAYGDDPADFIERPFVIMSDRMKSVLDRLGIDSIQYFKALLQRELDDVARSGYWLANIIGKVACADPLRSTYELVDGEPVAIQTLSISTERTLGLSIFRLAEDARMIVVSPRVQAVLQAAGLHGVMFQDAKDYNNALPIGSVASVPSAPGGL